MLTNARVQGNIIRKITNTRTQRKEITMDENARKRKKRNSSQGETQLGFVLLGTLALGVYQRSPRRYSAATRKEGNNGDSLQKLDATFHGFQGARSQRGARSLGYRLRSGAR